MIRILLSNAGRRTYLVEYILELKRNIAEYKIELYVSDVSMDVPSMNVSLDILKIITPYVADDPDNYAKALLRECIENNINIVFPLMDYELHVLSTWRRKFLENGIFIVVSDPWTISVTLNKQKCYEICRGNGLNVPKTWFSADNIDEIRKPLIMKEIEGSGSNNLKIIEDKDEIPIKIPKGFLLQEKIEGTEYGMDILNDINNNYVHCSVRKKIAMRCGETDKAEVLPHHNFHELARKISKAFKHRGNLDLDFIEDKDRNIWFIDFNPRFGGGYPFTHESGTNYLKFLVDSIMGRAVDKFKEQKHIVGSKGIILCFREI